MIARPPDAPRRLQDRLHTALDRLDALYQEGKAPSGLKLTLEDGSLGTFPLL
jgi:hypothetical protein